MGCCILKPVSDKSFFLEFKEGSYECRKILSRVPKYDGVYVNVLQLAYCDGLFIAECETERGM